MPKKESQRRQGSKELGDVYDDVKQNDGNIRRGAKLGRLVVNFDEEAFWIRRPDRASTRMSTEEIAYLQAHGLIEYDQSGMDSIITQYLMRLDMRNRTVAGAQIENEKNRRQIQEMKADTRLYSGCRAMSWAARLIWVAACVGLVFVAVSFTQPAAEPAKAAASIAGVGQNYGVSSELASNTTYIESLGSGSALYGVVLDTDIVEVGSQSSGSNPIKENILVNTEVSSEPIHMRPLYYGKTNFYQSMLAVNDSTDSATAVFLQNPSGYANTQVPANELILTGGSGLAQVALASPEDITDQGAAAAQTELEQKQQDQIKGNTSTNETEDEAAAMPAGWSGFDSCDIDGNIVVASYWYTRNNTQSKSDLQRRVAVFDVSKILDGGGESALTEMEAMQMNYQDTSSNFYAPKVSASPSANGSAHWIAYMKSTTGGTEGFFVRYYETASDIISEEYDNTLSTEDITGSSNPITNYTLYGDKLFFEQSGAIWVSDLSKIDIVIDGTSRTIKRENPVQICKTSEMKAYASRDEQHDASVYNKEMTVTSHYKVMTVTTDQGVEYGIAFLEAESGNLVYQPCQSLTTAAESVNAGTGANSTASGVMSSDEAAQAKSDAENEARNANRNKSSNSNTSNSNTSSNSNANTSSKQGSGSKITSSGSTGISIPEANPFYEKNQNSNTDSGNSGNSGNSNTNSSSSGNSNSNLVGNDNSSVNTNSNSTKTNTGDGVDNGRILIRAAKDNDILISAFTVRGEQLIWVETNQDSTKGRVMFSPVYYKNDASKILSEQLEEQQPEEQQTTGVIDTSNAAGGNTKNESVIPINPSSNTNSNSGSSSGNTNTSSGGGGGSFSDL